MDDEGFRRDLLQAPSLTVFAIEEPENHLAPYFLARIVKQVRSITRTHGGQAIFTSHSPAILGRIEPEEVRHFRLNSTSRTAIVREISLPTEAEEAAKYVREAVIAYPELYFARFVILAEGDSEQVVLPRLAAALDLDIDRAFVAITPLGGRHVNHFWRLLTDLCIPYVTLLDLDLGRQGGGWGRIKYACSQLLTIGVDKNQLLQVQNKDGSCRTLSDEELGEMDTWNACDQKSLEAWIGDLEGYGVFFSSPIDLDMLMLSYFPEAYKAVAPTLGGPRIPSEKDPKYQETIENAAATVLGENPELSLFPKELVEFFPWYRYLFLNKGKPGTHLIALSHLDSKAFAASSPAVLKRLLQHVHSHIKPDAV